jgi:pimeloyl-ACP methyl ester carboxylesterase
VVDVPRDLLLCLSTKGITGVDKSIRWPTRLGGKGILAMRKICFLSTVRFEYYFSSLPSSYNIFALEFPIYLPCLTKFEPNSLINKFTPEGTAQDTSLLLTHLSSYLPTQLPIPRQNLVLGISLGGHSVWHALLSDPRITTGVVIIGCPDFTRLMCQRAEKSRLKTWGPNFIGSPDFPPALVDAIASSDPAGLLLPSELKAPRSVVEGDSLDPSPSAQAHTAKLLDGLLKNKNILNLSGGADKLVPYSMSETFLKFLKRAIGPGGWWKDNGLVR